MKVIAKLSQMGIIDRNLATSCDGLKCEACLLAKAKKTPVDKRHDVKTTPQPDNKRKISEKHLIPGEMVSVDQYQVTVRGRLTRSFGKTAKKSLYSGGTIFYDHASGYVQLYHQNTLGSADTMRSKVKFEQECMHNGRFVKAYHADNGIFTSKQWREALVSGKQKIRVSGVGAHHQNGIAERAIQTIFSRARAMMIHAAIRWPDQTDSTLWPLAVDYAVHLHNNLPKDQLKYSPSEIFCGSKSEHYELKQARVWGCPVFVLDASLQDGKKLPKWQPRSRQGVYLGVSSEHASNVGLVMNLNTKHISPQYHLVYDELFLTVPSNGEVAPPLWKELFSKHRVQTSYDFVLDDEWKLPPEGVGDHSARDQHDLEGKPAPIQTPNPTATQPTIQPYIKSTNQPKITRFHSDIPPPTPRHLGSELEAEELEGSTAPASNQPPEQKYEDRVGPIDGVVETTAGERPTPTDVVEPVE